MTGGDNLSVRLASSLVLAPLALAAAWFGGAVFLIFWAGAALIIGWEWIKLVAPARDPLPWRVAGMIYAAIVFTAPVLLRADVNNGFVALVFLFAIVWMTDIMGYVVGRAFGGPKLWPAVSPNKTRSGAIGGMAGALAAGIVIAAALSLAVLPIAILSVILSMMAQAGDLFEIRNQAAVWSEGYEPSHPRTRRPDGSPGWFHHRSLGGGVDRDRAGRLLDRRDGTIGVVG